MADARFHYARSLAMGNKLDLALTELKAAVELSPENPHFHAALGELLHAMGRGDEAAKAMERAQELARRAPGGH